MDFTLSSWTKRMLSICRRGFRVSRQWLLEPKSVSEDAHRKEFLLNVTLLSTIILTAVCLAIVGGQTLILDQYHGVPFAGIAFIFGGLCFLLFLSRRGFFRTAASILVLLLLVPMLYSAIRWGVDLPLVILMDAFLIVMTSVLFGTRFAFFVSISMSAFLIIVSWMQTHGILEANHYWRLELFVLTDGITIAVALLLIATMTWLANREIAKSFLRERKIRQALQRERDLLEKRVEERTVEIKRLHAEQLIQMHKFVEFGKMSAGFFHDITSPLTAIAMDLEMVRSKETQQQAQEYLDRALRVTGRIEQYLADVQRYIREESSPIEFSVRGVLEVVKDLFAHKSARLNVDVEIECSEMMMLKGDLVKFQQVAANLISNAIDAYEDVADEGRCVVSVLAEAVEGGIQLTVTDHGHGIREDIIDRIWDPFFSGKEKRGGMGIGLSICKKIVEEDFKGSIICASRIGEGTEFSAYLTNYENGSVDGGTTA